VNNELEKKKKKGNGHGLIKVLFWHLLGGSFKLIAYPTNQPKN
jgi:hypothetical protein